MINKELKLITEWFRVNKLSINVKKTISFCSPALVKISSHTVADKILINDIPIKQVHSVKFLGVYLGEHLQFSIFDIYTLQVCQFMSNALPTNFSDYFEFNFNIDLYNTRQCSDLHINTVKTVKRSKSLRHNGPRIWNCLSHEIKLEKTFSTFTRKLKC